MQMVIRLPPRREKEMARLFTDLESVPIKSDLGIESYGINVASLEEIFIAATDHNEDQAKLTDEEKSREQQLRSSQESLCKLPPLLSQDQTTTPLFKQFSCTFLKRGKLSMRDWKTLLFEFVFPMLLIALVIALIRANTRSDMPVQGFSESIFASSEKPLLVPISENQSAPSHIVPGLTAYFNSQSGYLAEGNTTSSVEDFDKRIVSPRKSSSLKGGVYIESASTALSAYQYYMLVNTRSGASPFLLSSRLTEALVSNQLNKKIQVNAISHPLPLTSYQKGVSQTISSFICAVGFGFALSFKFASVIGLIVKEREERCKHQQKISGLRLKAYWSANLVFDFLTYLPLAILIGGLCHAFNLSDFVGDNSGATWAALIIYAPANLLFTYLLSFAYENHELAMAMHYFTNFILSGLIPAIIMILRTIGGNSSIAGRGVAWFLRLLPPYSFGEVLINLTRKTVIEVKENDRNSLPALSWQVTQSAIVYMGVLALIYGILLSLYEWLQNRTKSTSKSNSH